MTVLEDVTSTPQRFKKYYGDNLPDLAPGLAFFLRIDSPRTPSCGDCRYNRVHTTTSQRRTWSALAASGLASIVNAWMPTTCPTLLARLRYCSSNDAAWNEFVEHYGRHIYRWCRQWKLQEADAEDVTQEILLKLARKLRDFAYDPNSSFRGWLKTVAHHAWRDFVDGERRVRHVSDDRFRELLQSAEAREDLLRKLEEAFDHELLEEAIARVRLRVAQHTWEAFHLSAIEQLPVVEVATKVQMQVAMVYVAKSKVQKMLRDEIRKLEPDD